MFYFSLYDEPHHCCFQAVLSQDHFTGLVDFMNLYNGQLYAVYDNTLTTINPVSGGLLWVILFVPTDFLFFVCGFESAITNVTTMWLSSKPFSCVAFSFISHLRVITYSCIGLRINTDSALRLVPVTPLLDAFSWVCMMRSRLSTRLTMYLFLSLSFAISYTFFLMISGCSTLFQRKRSSWQMKSVTLVSLAKSHRLGIYICLCEWLSERVSEFLCVLLGLHLWGCGML